MSIHLHHMSIEQKRNIDAIFKAIIVAAIGFFGWLGNRAVNQFDTVKDSIETIRVDYQSMKTDIEWLKKTIKQKKDD